MRSFLLFILVSSYFNFAFADSIRGFSDTTAEIESNHLYPTVLDGNLATSTDSFARYTVHIQTYSDNWSPMGKCTGIIIAEDIILTAGHCFKSNGQNVAIKFGLAGKNKFEWIVNSKMYSALNDGQFFSGTLTSLDFPKANNIMKIESNSAIVNGRLNINYDTQKHFYEEVKNRQSLLNYVDNKTYNSIDTNLVDYGIVRISKLPPGYKPIPFYKGDYEQGQELYFVGYGRNHTEDKKNQVALRWSKAQLIGHYTKKNDITKGFQVYSEEKKAICFGDSGGPLVAKVNGVDYLVGINNFVYNNCGSDSWHLNIHYYIDSINEMIRKLRSLHSI